MLNETLAIIWERRTRIPRDQLEARMWSFGIARNILRRHRRHHSRTEQALHSVHVQDLLTDIRQSDPAQIGETNERDNQVWAALQELRPTERELVMLVHWDNLTLADAATLLSINPSTARTRYARAKQRLAIRLATNEQARSGRAGSESMGTMPKTSTETSF
ncbi:RNA polymerase sigma factor [Microbacterium arborescens]|uniref:RNA polymerase sigma factor n=1 Tax=Microbacterium arborescens TaxID=33883 RepID=UPI0025A14976|nr:sigma-70 family RNA polymerase sigma factor [Microbacterium arborescens]WJM15526.1 sigma-70 family RNA polymerase sigma factor [Microbacterium arborescens]